MRQWLFVLNDYGGDTASCLRNIERIKGRGGFCDVNLHRRINLAEDFVRLEVKDRSRLGLLSERIERFC